MPFEMDSTISIHAPRKGGDLFSMRATVRTTNFNPRPPAPHPSQRPGISIHAPRKGGDGSSANCCQPTPYFNPRPPQGGRLDWFRRCWRMVRGISIHAPREGGDPFDLSIGERRG